jgi:transcriptional regulator GlxA family with amidase domain
VHSRRKTSPGGVWIEQAIRHMVSASEAVRPGSVALLSKMAEALFIEALRRYAAELPPDQRGWLAAARDPVAGAALSLLHAEPARRWSVVELASKVAASRSVLTERFARLLGESPIRYLARWRMQLAARSLEKTSWSVLEVASRVGYESEAAFSRAFTRAFGVSPAAYRKRSRAVRET